MIDFQPLKLSQKQKYDEILFSCQPVRGCEYSFANKFLWGRQEAAFLNGCVVFFSHFQGRSVYPYPIGSGGRRAAVQQILSDARQRGIPCRITGLLGADRAELEAWFPGRFVFRTDREGFDYVYAIDDLADLTGRKYQKKRNHCHRFQTLHPQARLLPMTEALLPRVREMTQSWFQQRLQADPHQDFILETVALDRAFRHFAQLELEGLVLMEEDRILAMTMGSPLSPDTFDVHFEKAADSAPEAYAFINRGFARYLREKYPRLVYLNREDDMGLEGLRRAKLSYHPSFLTEKSWVCCLEDIHGDCHP